MAAMSAGGTRPLWSLGAPRALTLTRNGVVWPKERELTQLRRLARQPNRVGR
jgi:hypothetical protein